MAGGPSLRRAADHRGLIAVAHASVQFAKAGGAPMPMALAQRLVVNGFHRYVRNPMYVDLLIAIMGQALLFGSLDLLVYAGVLWIIMAAFVHWYK
jgi:protein-S-isoprenylcysteine O-methyltransferase Ste14